MKGKCPHTKCNMYSRCSIENYRPTPIPNPDQAEEWNLPPCAQVLKNKWIDVKFRPKLNKKVQMWGPKWFWGAGRLCDTDAGPKWFDDFNWAQGGGSSMRGDITHWMPLPEAPNSSLTDSKEVDSES